MIKNFEKWVGIGVQKSELWSPLLDNYLADTEVKKLRLPLAEQEVANQLLPFIKELFSPKDDRLFYVAQTVQERFDLLSKPSNLDFRLFKSVVGKKTYMLNDKEFYRFYRADNTIFCLHLFPNPVSGNIGLETFTFDVETNEVYIDANATVETRADYYAYRILCFVELAELEEITLQPKAKTSPKRKEQAVNGSKFSVTIVTKDWNIRYRIGTKTILGFFAIRHTGVGRTIPKLVWVDDYDKGEYVTPAKKEKVL